MISLKVGGNILEIDEGSHINFTAESGLGFYQKWEGIEAAELQEAFSRLARIAKVVMDKIAAAADPQPREQAPANPLMIN